jgi:transcriptional regulator with GAF, ATPase, and Fis domain/serine/threonine protein kinase/tetratricopeptide (TPR) repeat protein
VFDRRYINPVAVGRGAQAQIWKTFDSITGLPCLIKTGAKVHAEALLTLNLSHPFIVTPFDVGEHEKFGEYAVYPEVQDKTLTNVLHSSSTKDEVKRITLQLLEFLSFLHNRGWLYNDFKPEHFLIGQQLRVVDFGLCEQINGQKTSACFSGTFPYISPEKFTGKPYDHRSDLFSLGMIMLRCFLPDENWDLPPSFNSLMKLQASSRKLKGSWAKLISELTSPEPAQRPSTAEEVWTRLLPFKARRSFLFFPIPSYFELTSAIESNARVLRVCSPSRVNLQEAEKQILHYAWTKRTHSIVVDYSAESGESVLCGLCEALTGQKASDFYEAVEKLRCYQTDHRVWFIFRCGNLLRGRDGANFNLFLSYLSRTSWARAFVLLPGPPGPVLEEDWETVLIPSLSPAALQERADAILPSTSPAKIRSLLKRPFQLPEEVIDYLRMELPEEPSYARPAASHQASTLPHFFNVDSDCRKILITLALTGGAAPLWLFEKIRRRKTSADEDPISRLIDIGYLTRNHDRVCLTVTPESLLCRLRKNHRRQISSRLLKRYPLQEDPAVLYHVASNAGDKKTAAKAALTAAKTARKTNQSTAGDLWIWRAFKHGAAIRRTIIVQMARNTIRQAEFRKAERLIDHYGNHFGKSLSFYDLKLEFYHRQHKIHEALNTASLAVQWAIEQHKETAADYFRTRKAEFLILVQQFDEAEAILKELLVREKNSKEQIVGLANHTYGLLHFFRGRFRESILCLRKAAGLRHRLRAATISNLGVSYGTLKEPKKAEKYLRKAIEIFQKRHDARSLAHAFSNLGVVLKQTGKLSQAREAYFNTIYLGQACRNPNIILPALNNLAILAEQEGRSSNAIAYRKRAIRIARKAGLKQHVAVTLSNTGLQYAILGSPSRALRAIREAIQIRSESGLEGGLADSYENLGLVYLFGRKFSKAIQHLEHAKSLFANASREKDVNRLKIYLAITQSEMGLVPDLTEIQIKPDLTFEYGLYCYALALIGFKQNSKDRESKIRFLEAAHQAERIFRRFPSLFWLAKLLEIKAEILYENDNYERALVSLQAALNIYSRIGARMELIRFGKEKETMKLQSELLDKIAEKLPYRLLHSVREILAMENLEKMISRVLTLSMDFSGMERAVLVLHENPFRIYKSTSLEDTEVKEICEISVSAVQSTVNTQKPFVCLDAFSNPSFQSKPSIMSNRISSIVCLPLQVNDHKLGVLYLDSKEGVETLASTETVLLEIFGSIVALALNSALTMERMSDENTALKSSLDWNTGESPKIIGNSPALEQVLTKVNRLMDTTLPVLITGETGTGKELIARILHYGSKRRNGPFIPVNCSAFSKELLESELFGHEKGSFTGATITRRGLFEQAQDGTLFLDEIAEMPLEMQVKILRVAQDGEFRRVGGQQFHTNARLIFATNRDLDDMVKTRQFREDLYYRIRGAQIHIPSLRQRKEDIPLLATSFLKNITSAFHTTRSKNANQILGFSGKAIELMKKYDWPGNIRELKNEIERIAALTENNWVQPSDFDPSIQIEAGIESDSAKREGLLREIEKSTIENRLKQYDWNVASAAKSLGLSRHGLYSKMKRYQIQTP